MKPKPAFSNFKLWIVITCAIIVLCLTIIACSKSSDNNMSAATQVYIKGFAFSISSLTVINGTTVTWTNNDATAHTVTADDNSFDSGNIASGSSFSKTFSAAGTFAYHCKIHTTMTANIIVE